MYVCMYVAFSGAEVGLSAPQLPLAGTFSLMSRNGPITLDSTSSINDSDKEAGLMCENRYEHHAPISFPTVSISFQIAVDLSTRVPIQSQFLEKD